MWEVVELGRGGALMIRWNRLLRRHNLNCDSASRCDISLQAQNLIFVVLVMRKLEVNIKNNLE